MLMEFGFVVYPEVFLQQAFVNHHMSYRVETTIYGDLGVGMIYRRDHY